MGKLDEMFGVEGEAATRLLKLTFGVSCPKEPTGTVALGLACGSQGGIL